MRCSTVASLASCVAIIEVEAEGYMSIAAVKYGRFDELRDIMVGLSGKRAGVVAG
jgi:hypothetical protein